MSSVNSYCTIILEYLVVRDINIISVKLRCLHPTFSLVTLVRGVEGKLSRLVYLAPRPGFESGSVISQFLLHHNLGIFSCKRCEHYFSQTEMLHLTFSSVILVRGVGAKLSWLVYLAPRPGFESGSVISQFLLHHNLGIFSCKRCEHYFSQTEMLHLTFSSVILVRGVGGKLSRLVYLAPHPGFESGSVISQFLLHHNLGIFSCKRCEHYFSQTEMFTFNVQFGCPCPRGGGQAVQAGLSCPPPRIWVKQYHQLTLIAP